MIAQGDWPTQSPNFHCYLLDAKLLSHVIENMVSKGSYLLYRKEFQLYGMWTAWTGRTSPLRRSPSGSPAKCSLVPSAFSTTPLSTLRKPYPLSWSFSKPTVTPCCPSPRSSSPESTTWITRENNARRKRNSKIQKHAAWRSSYSLIVSKLPVSSAMPARSRPSVAVGIPSNSRLRWTKPVKNDSNAAGHPARCPTALSTVV